MNTKNSAFFPLLKPFIDLGSLALDQLEDQVASGREIRISLPKIESPNAPRLTNPLDFKNPSPSNSDSRNILVDRFEPFSVVTSNGLTVEGNKYYEYPNSHHGDDEVEADGFPMFDPQQLQQATPQSPTTLTALTSLSNTFLLHSNPFATKTIYLDFNGHILPANTGWTNRYNGGNAIIAPAWSMDADNTTFSDAELTRIQAIWQRVAEDFAPFNVDVTTDFRGEDYLTRSSSSDQVYGMRALISPISSFVGSFGGIAYLNVFGMVEDFYKPALIFPENLGPNGEKYIAEAISHEVGHNLGLNHDGTSTQGYYTGQGSGATGWAPIMLTRVGF